MYPGSSGWGTEPAQCTVENGEVFFLALKFLWSDDNNDDINKNFLFGKYLELSLSRYFRVVGT